MLPMLRLHISGLARTGAARRSSRVMPRPPPVVMFITASVLCLMTGRKRMNTCGVGGGFAGVGVAGVQVDDGGAGLGGGDGLGGDVLGVIGR